MKRLQCSLFACLLFCMASLSACASSFWLAPFKKEANPKHFSSAPKKKEFATQKLTQFEDGVLLAEVGSQEEAEQIAVLYGITLDSTADTVAKYTTDQDIMELIALGQKNGWPAVQPNFLYDLH